MHNNYEKSLYEFIKEEGLKNNKINFFHLYKSGIDNNYFIPRFLFCYKLKELAPHVIDNLFKLLPLFDQALQEFDKKSYIVCDYSHLISLINKTNNRYAIKLLLELNKWADLYNLNSIWLLDTAVKTLASWNKYEEHKEGKTFVYSGNI